jgi:tripartite-type tricarboxylate transporter receptor subunit TctC
MLRRRLLPLLAAPFILPRAAHAQGVFGGRPIRIIVPFPAGGASDAMTRAYAELLEKHIGNRVVVDNRAGAGGNIGVEAAARAPADGTTLVTSGPNIINTRYLIRDTPFQWARDLDTFGLMFASPNVLVVHPSLPVRTVPEFIAHARANPGKLNYASAGAGGSIHLSAEMFQKMTGAQMVHVPYRGDALARTDLTSGAVQVMFNSIATSVQPVLAGTWRGLAVTGLKRAAALPDLPTLDEAGLPGYEVTSWMGLFGPKGIPAPVKAELNRGFAAAFADPAMQAAATRLGQDMTPSTPEAHLAFMQRQETVWKPILEGIGFSS